MSILNLNRSGKEKAPGLLNGNANHLLTQNAQPRDRGLMPSATAERFRIKMIGITKVLKFLLYESDRDIKL